MSTALHGAAEGGALLRVRHIRTRREAALRHFLRKPLGSTVGREITPYPVPRPGHHASSQPRPKPSLGGTWEVRSSWQQLGNPALGQRPPVCLSLLAAQRPAPGRAALPPQKPRGEHTPRPGRSSASGTPRRHSIGSFLASNISQHPLSVPGPGGLLSPGFGNTEVSLTTTPKLSQSPLSQGQFFSSEKAWKEAAWRAGSSVWSPILGPELRASLCFVLPHTAPPNPEPAEECEPADQVANQPVSQDTGLSLLTPDGHGPCPGWCGSVVE